MRGKPKKAAYHSGKNSWKDYHAQFELVAMLNGWNEETKAFELATNLRVSVRSILADLDADKRNDYESLVSESLPELGTRSGNQETGKVCIVICPQ